MKIKTTTVYINKYTGDEFTSAERAKAAEKKSKALRDTFSFVKNVVDPHCDFANGRWCVQRDEEYHHRFAETLMGVVRHQVPNLIKAFKKNKVIFDRNTFITLNVNRYLYDYGKYEIGELHSRLINICPECYREYGQWSFKKGCRHNGTLLDSNALYKCPTRSGKRGKCK